MSTRPGIQGGIQPNHSAELVRNSVVPDPGTQDWLRALKGLVLVCGALYGPGISIASSLAHGATRSNTTVSGHVCVAPL